MLPRPIHTGLQELAVRLIDARKPNSDLNVLARDLYAGLHELCMRAGQDGVLAELNALDGFDEDRLPPLVAQLTAAELDGGGPRAVRPKQLADAVVTALSLTLVDPPDRWIRLSDDTRTAVAQGVGAVLEPELARVRESIIAAAREAIDSRHQVAFEKIAKELDDRGQTLVKTPKVPLDSVQAAQRVLVDVRRAYVDRVGRKAIDRAKEAIARENPEAAARIDTPVTLKLTPRDVAILRAADPRVQKTAAGVGGALLAALAELAQLAWTAAEKVARPYAASQRFTVGELIDHPKLGRGTVVGVEKQRMDVEFADGKKTLVHAGK